MRQVTSICPVHHKTQTKVEGGRSHAPSDITNSHTVTPAAAPVVAAATPTGARQGEPHDQEPANKVRKVVVEVTAERAIPPGLQLQHDNECSAAERDNGTDLQWPLALLQEGAASATQPTSGRTLLTVVAGCRKQTQSRAEFRCWACPGEQSTATWWTGWRTR